MGEFFEQLVFFKLVENVREYVKEEKRYAQGICASIYRSVKWMVQI